MRRFLLFIFPVIALALIPAGAAAQTKVIQGNSRYGEVLYNWDGKYLRQGDSQYGEILYNFDGVNVRSGQSQYSTVLFNISGTLPAAILILLLM